MRTAPDRAAHARRGRGAVAVACLVLLVAGCGSDSADNAAFAAAYAAHQAAEVTVQGAVTAVLDDAPAGADGPHQRFDVSVAGTIVEIDHNLSLAARVPVLPGTVVLIHGQFEPDPGHPVIHYTHHGTGSHEGGWIEVAGRRYE